MLTGAVLTGAMLGSEVLTVAISLPAAPRHWALMQALAVLRA
jgi:hypothetical protein